MLGLFSPYPPAAFRFAVTFGLQSLLFDTSFREVSGIGPELETEPVPEGGENRFVHMLPKAMKHPRLSLKRGIAGLDSLLLYWCSSVLEGGLVKPINPKLMHVFLLDEIGFPLRVWSFENAYPVHMEIEAFNSTKNEVAIEKIELSYAFSKRLI